ncbi:hypothetical protein OE88DRAFT_1740277, partial [Heliocybe sulcata]
SEAEFLVAPEARAHYDQIQREKDEKERLEKEKSKAKKTAELETAVRRAALLVNDKLRYRGSLKSRRKPELEDIAHVLRLDYASLTQPQIVDAIVAKLTADPFLRLDARFEGLYSNVKLPAEVTVQVDGSSTESLLDSERALQELLSQSDHNQQLPKPSSLPSGHSTRSFSVTEGDENRPPSEYPQIMRAPLQSRLPLSSSVNHAPQGFVVGSSADAGSFAYPYLYGSVR